MPTSEVYADSVEVLFDSTTAMRRAVECRDAKILIVPTGQFA